MIGGDDAQLCSIPIPDMWSCWAMLSGPRLSPATLSHALSGCVEIVRTDSFKGEEYRDWWLQIYWAIPDLE